MKHLQYLGSCLSSLLVLFAAAAPQLAAQGRAAQLDVVGLKLGMTIQQAQQRLRELQPGIWLATYYATEDDRWWRGGLLPQTDAGSDTYHPFHNAKIHVPISLVAGYIETAYSQEPNRLAVKPVNDENTPIDFFSGDFFRLSFTPTDDGGKLYAIVRQRIYFSQTNLPLNFYLSANVPLPQKADLLKGVTEKYGPPSIAEDPNELSRMARSGFMSLYWSYDRSGAQLTPDLSNACQSRFLNEDGVSNRYSGKPKSIRLYSSKATRNLTSRQLSAAFANRDFYKVRYFDSQTSLEEDISRIADLVPAMVLPDGRLSDAIPENQKPPYQACGPQLHVVLVPMTTIGESDHGYALAMTVSLSDQRAVLFDNGVAEYMKKQIELQLPKAPPPPPKEKF